MSKKVTDARSRKVIKFPIPKRTEPTGDPEDKIKDIDKQVFDLLCHLRPIEPPAPVQVTDEMSALFVMMFCALVSETKGKGAGHG